MRQSNFMIDYRDYDNKILIIRDIGPWDRYLSVTNDAENVVKLLINNGTLQEGYRLFYYDSENQCDEIIIENGKFAGFNCVT